MYVNIKLKAHINNMTRKIQLRQYKNRWQISSFSSSLWLVWQ